MTNAEKLAFEEEIAAIAAGEAEAIERHIDKLSDDEEARDLRHDASEIAEGIAASGDDYVHPASFETDLLALIDAEDTTVSEAIDSDSESDLKPGELASEALSDSSSNKNDTSKDNIDNKKERKSAKEDPAKIASEKKDTQSEVEKLRKDVGKSATPAAANENRSPLLWVGAGAAATFLLVVGGMQLGSNSDNESGKEVATSGNTSALLTAEVTHLDRSTKDGRSGISIVRAGESSSEPLEVGGRIAAGDTLQTDARSRIILSMSDDSSITLAANSILLFDAKETRTIALKSGELVAKVAHHEDGPNAFYKLPNGAVEVLGTKFSLSADGEYSNVRVAEGIVSLHGSKGDAIKVRAGEEGILNKENAPTVSPALYVSESMRWSELGPEAEEDRGGSGLGELRAYKPGQSRDTDWPMALQNHKVTVRVVGNVARTEIEEVFRNDSTTVLEGVYTFPLPAGAQIDKLALDVDGKFEEGAIVEKGRASKIWKGVIAKATNKKPKKPSEIIWVPGPWRDPALLEWKEGNRFQLRIFPIPKEGTRTIKLAYTQVIAPQGDRRRYTYPLPRSEDGSSIAENFAFDMRLRSADPESTVRTPGYEMKGEKSTKAQEFQFERDAFVPNGDIVVDYRAKGQSSELQAWGFQGSAATPPSLAYRGKKRSPRKEVLEEQKRIAGDTKAYALLALRPHLPRWTEQRNRDFVIVVDSSQSMTGARFERATRAASELIGELSPRDRAIVMACDLECKLYDKRALRPSAAKAREVQTWLGTINPAGASFIENSLDFAASSTELFDKKSDKRERVVVYIGDGVASMGHRSLAVLSDSATELRVKHNTSFTTVAIGADSDSRALGTIARAGGGYFIEYKPGRNPTHMAQAVLETTTGVALRDAKIIFPKGMTALSSEELGTLRAGDELLVSARFDSEIDDKIIIKGSVGGKPFENSYPLHLKLAANPGNAFVPKIWASQTIERLESESQAGNRDTIVALSKAYGVMSKQTALLVLESEAMFKAFGVDRAKALSQWTGEEGEAESSESMGGTNFAMGDLSGGARKQLESLGYLGDWGASGAGKGGGSGYARTASTHAADASDEKAAKDSDMEDLVTKEGKKSPKKKSRKPSESRPAPGLIGRRSRGSWMRRVWFRTAAIENYSGTPDNVRDAISRGETLLALNPDSRTQHASLIQALSYAGQLERAEEVAKEWMKRDRLDPEALSYLADIYARRGMREESIRLLSGVVDLRANDMELHLRLAKAYDRAGDTRLACAHRVMLAELDSESTTHAANAVRCENQNRRGKRADAILATIDVTRRGRVERASQTKASPERSTGDLRIRGTWTGADDLDIAIITPTGKRISWLGGHKRSFAQNSKESGRETLGLTRIRKGRYLIEVSRTNSESTMAVRGELSIELLGKKQRIPFRLDSESAIVGRALVRMDSRMEAM